MNIKIKATGIACLLGDDYDRVYTALTRQFGKGSECLFTERIAGHEYLQWILPGDGWTALAQGDPIMADQVRRELKTRQQNVVSRFGANADMAHRVLTVPDDEYVYYKADANGTIDIKLTAWGYRYPERVDGGNATGIVAPTETTENVSVRLIYAGEPLPDKEFKLNGFKRVTDENGMLTIGNLPVGYRFDIEADSSKRQCMVTAGESVVELDCTVYSNIDITVKKDGTAAAGTTVSINYEGKDLDVTTDALGHASAKLPMSLSGALCTVTAESEKQQQSLRAGLNTFDFELKSPAVVPPVVPPDLPQPPDTESPLTDPGKPDQKDEKVPVPENEVKTVTDPEPEKKEKKDDKQPSKGWLWTLILLILALAILTGLTYYLGKTILFG